MKGYNYRIIGISNVAKSICQFNCQIFIFEDLPRLNIFLGTKDGAVNKIGRNPGSQGFLSYTGGERQ